MKRNEQIRKLSEVDVWDIAVIGGGATGLGICLDAALRGYKVVLLEAVDFSKGTSSRSTKLVHGGVRYLANGDVGLVMEALYERGLLMKNAPHLVKNQSFIIPVFTWMDAFKYTVGLKLYDFLASKLSLGKSTFIEADEVKRILPSLKFSKLKGGVLYHDGQFDDSRLAVNLAQSCTDSGGCVINHMPVTGFLRKSDNTVSGVVAKDIETNTNYHIYARSIINSTGVFVDGVLQMDQPDAHPMVKPSQGVHIVIDKRFLRSRNAIMIPKTDDKRVLFAIPWYDKVLLGTTDTVIERVEKEPKALEEEIDFILRTASRYLSPAPQRDDILSVFAGLRPLAAPSGNSKTTREISRRHKIIVSPSGLITITGGKWTTYRRMAEDVVDIASKGNNLPFAKCITKNFKIHGWGDPEFVYGSDNSKIQQLISENNSLGIKLHNDFDYNAAHVIWAVREEMARTLEDVLARRLRILFLNVQAALEISPKVAEIMASEMKYDKMWVIEQVKKFEELAKNFMIKP